MDNNKHPDIDRFFNKMISDPDPENAVWNIPPERVFRDAIEMVEKKRSERRRILFFWSFGASSVILLIGLLIFNLLTVEHINEKVDDIIDKQNAVTSLDTGSDRLDNTQSDQSLEAEKEQTSKPAEQKTIDRNNRGAFDSNAAGKNILPAVRSPDENQPTEGEIVDPFVAENVRMITIQPLEPQFVVDQLLPYLAIDAIPDSQFFSFEEAPIESNTDQSGTEWFIQGGPNSSTLKMKNLEVPVSELTKYDQWYSGFEAGVGFQKRITGRFGVISSLNYSVFNNQSNFTFGHSYVKSNETVSQSGELQYTALLHLMTPTGIHPEVMNVPLEKRDIQDKETLTSITDIKSKISYLTLSSGVSFLAHQAGSFSVAVDAGIGLNYLAGMQESMDSRIYLGSDMLQQGRYSSSSKNQARDFLVNGNLNASFRYDISKYFSAGVKFGAGTSLQSILRDETVTLSLSKFQSMLFIAFRP